MESVGLIVVLCFISTASAYSSGAPVSDEICTSLRPNHPGEPQSQKFPYKLRLSRRTVAPSGLVELQITGTSQPFKGFLVQGRNQNFEKDSTPVGSFVTHGRENELQGIDCFNLENSAVTHRNGAEKRNVTIAWTAPQQRGTYVLLTTVVASGKVYWVGHATPTITVQ